MSASANFALLSHSYTLAKTFKSCLSVALDVDAYLLHKPSMWLSNFVKYIG